MPRLSATSGGRLAVESVTTTTGMDARLTRRATGGLSPGGQSRTSRCGTPAAGPSDSHRRKRTGRARGPAQRVDETTRSLVDRDRLDDGVARGCGGARPGDGVDAEDVARRAAALDDDCRRAGGGDHPGDVHQAG